MKQIKHIFFLFFLLAGVTVIAQEQDEQLAAQYYQNGEFDKAVVLYEKLYKKNNREDFYYRYYLKCLAQLEQFDEAEKLVKKQIKRKGENPLYFIDMGVVHKQQGDERKAEQQFTKAIRSLQPSQQQVKDVAGTFVEIGEFDHAIATYQRGKRMLGDIYTFNFDLAEVYSYKNDNEAMINEYLDALLITESFMDKVQNALQTTVGEGDKEMNELLQTTLIKKVQQYPNRQIFAELLIWHFIQQEDFNAAFIQAKALDKRLDEAGSRLIELANIAKKNEEYDVAIKSLKYVIAKGSKNYFYNQAKMDLVEVMNKKITEQHDYTQAELEELEQLYISTIDELGKNSRTVNLMRGLAHLKAFYLHNTGEAIEILQEAKQIARVDRKDLAHVKLELGDVYLLTGEIWEATLLYSQVDKMFKHDPLGQLAKYKNAKLSFYNGEFDWAQAQLNVLKSATSQLIANDALYLALLISDNSIIDTSYAALEMFARADLLYFQNKHEKALTTLDSINEEFPGHALADDILFKKAQIFKEQNEYEKVVENLEKLISTYSFEILADDALYMLAKIHDERYDDKPKAMELYQRVLLEYPGSLYTVEARKRYRELRGDRIN